jgi:hypothetical protein
VLVLSASSEGIPETTGAGSLAKRRRGEEKKDREDEKKARDYDMAFKSNLSTAMTGLSYSSLLEQANNKNNLFLKYTEMSMNERCGHEMKAKLCTMADEALEAAKEIETQALEMKAKSVDLSSSSDITTPTTSRGPTPASSWLTPEI